MDLKLKNNSTEEERPKSSPPRNTAEGRANRPGPLSSKTDGRRSSAASSAGDAAEPLAKRLAEVGGEASPVGSPAECRSAAPSVASSRSGSRDRVRSPVGDDVVGASKRPRRTPARAARGGPRRIESDSEGETDMEFDPPMRSAVGSAAASRAASRGGSVGGGDNASPCRSRSPRRPASSLGPGRPPTTGDYVGYAAAKETAAQARLLDADVRLEEEVARGLMQAARPFAQRGDGTVGGVPIEELLDSAESAAAAIECVAAKSKNIKGTMVKKLRLAAQAVRTAANEMALRVQAGLTDADSSAGSTASTSEVKRLNKRLETSELENRALRAELQALRALREASAVPPPPSTSPLMEPPKERRAPRARTRQAARSEAMEVEVESRAPSPPPSPPPPMTTTDVEVTTSPCPSPPLQDHQGRGGKGESRPSSATGASCRR